MGSNKKKNLVYYDNFKAFYVGDLYLSVLRFHEEFPYLRVMFITNGRLLYGLVPVTNERISVCSS